MHKRWPELYLVLRWMVLLHSQTLISKNQYAVDKDSFLPIFHAVFDEVLAKAISKLLLKDGESVIDVGAGVGQAGHALRALLPELDYRGYDGICEVCRFHSPHGRGSF